MSRVPFWPLRPLPEGGASVAYPFAWAKVTPSYKIHDPVRATHAALPNDVLGAIIRGCFGLRMLVQCFESAEEQGQP